MGARPVRIALAPALSLALLLTLAVSGCSYRTFGAPHGRLTLTATFDDVQGLVAGHSVKMSDLTIGSVTKVELDGYRAKATLSIEDGVRIPRGTRAEIATTSLLGENYVDLRMPPGASMDRGPFLADHAALARTSVRPSFEQVVGQAGPLVKALAGNDARAVVDAGAAALSGNGGRLNATVAEAADLVALLAEQRRALGESVDRLARLGRSLAAGRDALREAPGRLARLTALVDDDKTEILRTVDRLTRLAARLDDTVLAGRVRRFRRLLRDLDPVLAELGGDRKRLTDLVDGLVTFSDKLPRASYDGQVLLYPLLRFVWPDGTPVLPGQEGPRTGHGTSGAPGSRGSPGAPRLPGRMADALPDLEKILEPRR